MRCFLVTQIADFHVYFHAGKLAFTIIHTPRAITGRELKDQQPWQYLGRQRRKFQNLLSEVKNREL